MAEKKLFRQGRTRLVEGEGVDPSIIPQTFQEFEADQARPGAQGIEEYFENQLSKAEERVADAEKNRADNPSKASQAELTAAKAALETAQNSLTTLTDLTDVSKIDQLKILRENKTAQEEQTRYEDKPTEDPGEGNFWSYNVKEGRWKKVKGFQSGSDIDYDDGNNFGSGNFGSGNTGNTGNTASTDALLAFNKAQAAAELQSKRESAFGILKKEFDKYGLSSLIDSVKNLILTGSSPEEVVLRLRETPEYLKRFAGNKLRLDAGLNVYDEATYLDLENAYDQIFTSYGVEEAAGNTRAARQAKYAEFIGGTKSPDEIKGRVQLAVLASQEDAVTKATMKELYPMLTDKDLVSYFLNPKETLPKLETKIRAAQVGAAAVRQGLVTNVATAEELVGLGVTEEEAEKVYSAYAYDKPRIDLLSGLDPTKDNQVNQQVAEGALLKNLASEQRKLDLLKQKELGRFGGSAGAARNLSLSRELGGTY
jgi:hypothetical protein